MVKNKFRYSVSPPVAIRQEWQVTILPRINFGAPKKSKIKHSVINTSSKTAPKASFDSFAKYYGFKKSGIADRLIFCSSRSL
jgi:hypothetical protein